MIVWDAETRQVIRKFDGQLGVVLSLAYSPDGQRIASSSINPENTFVVWEAGTGKVSRRSRATPARSTGCDYSPDGRLIASADTDGKVRLWDAEHWRRSARSTPITGRRSACHSPRTGSISPRRARTDLIRVWETATGRKVREMPGHNGSA